MLVKKAKSSFHFRLYVCVCVSIGPYCIYNNICIYIVLQKELSAELCDVTIEADLRQNLPTVKDICLKKLEKKTTQKYQRKSQFIHFS